jgi:uncharacterized membrane protein YgcG
MFGRLALCLVLILAPGLAQAAEEILSFDVLVEVQPDGALEVTERIRVTAEGREIRRGIYRDFPVEYAEPDGRVSRASFDVEWVRRNGTPEPHFVESTGSNRRLYIGDADVFLPTPSEQTYEYRYRTEGQLRAQDGFDELFWNVTGNDWAFPINASSVQIVLPGGVPIIDHTGFTGPRGATGDDFTVQRVAEGVYRARTTAVLAPGEGWSVAISWPAGMIEIPPIDYVAGARAPRSVGGAPMTEPASVIAALIGALAMFWGWLRVGRDPARGVVYPRFEPPAGLSPAATGFVRRQGYDRRCMTAAIVSMAVKGALRIEETEKGGLFGGRRFSLVPLGREGKALSNGETGVYDKLFPFGATLELKSDKTNGKRVDRARSELADRLWKEHYGASFKTNLRQSLTGIGIGLAAGILLVGYAANWTFPPMFLWIVGVIGGGVLALTLGRLIMNLIAGRRAGFGGGRGLNTVLFFIAFGAVFGMQGFVAALMMFQEGMLDGQAGVGLAGVVFGFAAGIFHYLMAAPTKAGRALLDEIEGFEMYMETAEEDRLDILNPPEKTPELFETLLPYAVALGLSHQWSAKFAGVLAGATVADWYHGPGRFDPDSFDRGFNSAVSSTSAPSSRSSSGFSGGSSGGGGGGGGGGGW